MILFSGMLYERHSVRPWLRWIQDLSLMNYSFATLVMNEARQGVPDLHPHAEKSTPPQC